MLDSTDVAGAREELCLDTEGIMKLLVSLFKLLCVAVPGLVTVQALSAQTTQSHSNTNAIAIPSSQSNTTGSSSISVTGRTGLISKITVTLNNYTGRLGELDFMLVAPGGQRFVLLSDSGSQGTTITNVTLTLDDDGASHLGQGAGTSPASSSTTTWKPTNFDSNTSDSFNSPAPTPSFPSDFAANATGVGAGTATFASQFNGTNPNGSWTLYVDADVAGPQEGIAGGWTLTITTTVAQSPTTLTLSSSPNPSFRTAPNDVATFTASLTSNGSPVSGQSISFTINGTTTPATTNAGGQATTTRTFPLEGTYTATASFTGTASLGSSNTSSTHTVQSHTTGTPPTFCNDGNLRTQTGTVPVSAIPYPQTVSVSGLTGTVSKVTVTLNGLSHPSPDDLDFLLVSPDGKKVIILADAGGTSSTVPSPVTITLDDNGAVIPDAGPLSTGTFSPANYAGSDGFAAPAPAGPYGSALASFNGVNPNGEWSLFAATDIPGNTGNVLNGFCLNFTQSTDVLTTTTLSVSPSPSITNTPVTLTAQVRRLDTNAAVTSGSVSFLRNGVLLGSSNLNGSGEAALSNTPAVEGSYTYSATFNGSAGVAVSSASVTHQVDNPTTQSNLTFCNPGPVTSSGTGAAIQYPSRLKINGLAGVLSGISLQINNLTLTSANEVDMLLAGPEGQNLVFWSDVGSLASVSSQSFTITDSAASQLPVGSPIAGGTYRPTAVNTEGTLTFPAPAPSGPYNAAAPFGASTLDVFSHTNPNGYWSLFLYDDIPDTVSSGQIGNWCATLTLTPPDISITKTHSGSFSAGQTGTYTIRVTNNGPGSTAGTVTVADTLPADLTVQSIAGNGWTCSSSTATCTRSDALLAGNSYPDITLVVNVSATSAASVTNRVDVSGGGDATVGGNNRAQDVTAVILPADLTLTKSHSGSFRQGQSGAAYSIRVSNVGSGGTSGLVTVADNLPSGLTATALSGPGWACTLATLSCTRSDTLAGGSAYPDISLTVDVSARAASSVTNQAVVTGGGDSNSGNNVANDPTAITQLVSVTVGAVPGGLTFAVDDVSYTSPQVFSWEAGSTHKIATTSPQGSGGTRYIFQTWSDGGGMSHNVTVSAAVTAYTANFQRQVELTTAANPAAGGTVSPSGGFFDAGQSVALTATANACYTFGSWSANAPGGTVVMSSPQLVTATFNASTAANVSGRISASFGGFRLNRATNRWLQTVTLTNTGPALSDVALVLDGLSGGTLFGPSGVTSCAAPAGSPYRSIGALGSGATASVTLEFVAPTTNIQYSRRFLAGPENK